MSTTINNDINSLTPNFRKKFDLWRSEVKAKYPSAMVFETRRSQERQNWLYAQGRTRPGKIVTRTLNSNHLTGNAVDIVFYQNGNPTRNGPYDDLIAMAKKYGIRNLKPKETCHFEDDGTPYNPPVSNDPLPLVAEGVWNGERENEPATREEVAIMLERVIKLLSK